MGERERLRVLRIAIHSSPRNRQWRMGLGEQRPLAADSKTVEDAKVQTTRDNNQREVMNPFADRLFSDMGPNSSQSVTKAGVFLRGLPNFIAKTREAGLSQKSVIATTLRLFPEIFTVKTSAKGGAATLETKARAPLKPR